MSLPPLVMVGQESGDESSEELEWTDEEGDDIAVEDLPIPPSNTPRCDHVG